MKLTEISGNISKAICQSALKVANKTVDQAGNPPLCTIILHQPDVPKKLRRNQEAEEVN